jgi:hypothetical protein
MDPRNKSDRNDISWSARFEMAPQGGILVLRIPSTAVPLLWLPQSGSSFDFSWLSRPLALLVLGHDSAFLFPLARGIRLGGVALPERRIVRIERKVRADFWGIVLEVEVSGGEVRLLRD